MNCNVCSHPLSHLIYDSSGSVSITSLCRFYPGKTEVFLCEKCSHIQTRPIENIEAYYADSYDLLLEDDEEDQLYRFIDGKPIFRIDHQANVLVKKFNFSKPTAILDFGCGKGSVLGKICQRQPHVKPHFFDVSDSYISFWKKQGAAANQWAVNSVPEEWNGTFDVVTSFFSLEHVSDPQNVLKTVRSLLKNEGLFYLVIPNVFTNWADLVVVDHINHFTDASLKWLLDQCGFEALETDTSSHESATIVIAKAKMPQIPSVNSTQRAEILRIAAYWKGVSEKVREFETQHGESKKVAIYGSGFYGTYLATCLKDLSRVRCFLDRDPYKQGKFLLDKPILAPIELEKSISTIYVGLNPNNALQNIELVSEWKERSHNYFFL